MATSFFNALLSGSGVIIAALLTYLGTRHTQRQAQRAQTMAAQIEQSKVDAAAYSEARKIWDGLITDLRGQVADQRKELADMRVEARAFRDRLADLEQKRAGDRKAIHTLTVYARQLLKALEDNHITPPLPPEGLDLDGEPWEDQ